MKFDTSKAGFNKLLSFCCYEIMVCASSEGINSCLESRVQIFASFITQRKREQATSALARLICSFGTSEQANSSHQGLLSCQCI